jgi:hypothetical protein
MSFDVKIGQAVRYKLQNDEENCIAKIISIDSFGNKEDTLYTFEEEDTSGPYIHQVRARIIDSMCVVED